MKNQTKRSLLLKYTCIKSAFLSLFFTFYAYGAEQLGVIEDTFFKDPQTIVSVRQLIPHDTIIMAIVDGTTNTENRTLSVRPFFTKTWIHNDEEKESQCKIGTTIVCGHRTLGKDFTQAQKYTYLFLREVEDKTSELTLGGKVTFYAIKEFKREDGSIFREKGVALYELELKEERIPAADVTVCFKEWTITSKWQRKLRHSRRHYSAVDVYHTTFKTFLGMTLTGKEPELVSRGYFRKELRFKATEAETPECGTNGGNLPVGSIIL